MLTRPARAALAVLFASTLALAAPATQPAAYPLTVDVMTGEPLPAAPIVEQVEGREVRFATQASADAFKAGGEASHKKMDELVVAAQQPDYKLATCPVTDEKLGSMGKPVQHVDRASNRLIQLCCKGCLKSAKKDPAAAMKKIDEAAAKD